ncbi:MAG: hypothetical protein ACRDTA_18505 [Pseudonocardiaceae bacterium]
MAEDLLAQLAGTDRRSVGRSNEVADQVLASPKLFKQLIDGMIDDDPVIRMRCADAAEKVTAERPELLSRYRDRLLGELARIPQQEVKWHVAQMIPRLRLDAARRCRAVEVLRGYLQDDSRIVQVSALQALTDLAREHGDELTPEITTLLHDSARNGVPSVRARARKLLKKLDPSDLG